MFSLPFARRIRLRRTKRRGYLYIAVVFTTLIVGAIAMTGLSLQADNLAANREGGQWAQARALADSGVQWGLAKSSRIRIGERRIRTVSRSHR